MLIAIPCEKNQRETLESRKPTVTGLTSPADRSDRSGPTASVGVLTRWSGSQLVNAACFLVPNVDARGNTVTHGFILVLAAGPYVQQGGCARALYYLAPGVLVVGDTSEVREGGRLPSLC